ncbi:MAG: Wzz/FepE/Etk N-terminal domain-containing protein, partial [Anaerolineae bacterium]|nr:Wzz/FepE/Etk N-terminal domain-containing protein [Anaerolineae bacterium]
MDDEATNSIEIRRYLELLRRWLWLIVLGTALAAGSAYVASRLSTPIYEASATLLISEGQKPTGPDYNALLLSERLAKTYAQMLKGKPILDETAARLGTSLDAAEVSVEPVRDTQLIRLKVRHPDPALAAGIANTIPPVFIEVNEQAQSARFKSSIENLTLEMKRLEGEIEATEHALEAERAKGDGRSTHLEALLAQYRSTYADLLQSYEEIRTAQAQATDSVIVFEP